MFIAAFPSLKPHYADGERRIMPMANHAAIR
jgi:hypothetical protein